MNAIVPRQSAADSPIVKAWLVRLHEMTAGSTATRDATDRLTIVLEQLAIGRYGVAAFTRRSLEHVGSRCRFWPSYGELCEALDDWLVSEQEGFGEVALDRRDEAGLNGDDRSWLEFYRRREQEISDQHDDFRWGSRDAEMANLQSLVRAQSWNAWRVISPDSIVVRDRPSDYQIQAVASALRMPGGPLEGRPVEPEPETRMQRPSYFAGEALARSRRARGIAEPASSEGDGA